MQYALYGSGYVTVAVEYGQDISAMMDLNILGLQNRKISEKKAYFISKTCIVKFLLPLLVRYIPSDMNHYHNQGIVFSRFPVWVCACSEWCGS